MGGCDTEQGVIHYEICKTYTDSIICRLPGLCHPDYRQCPAGGSAAGRERWVFLGFVSGMGDLFHGGLYDTEWGAFLFRLHHGDRCVYNHYYYGRLFWRFRLFCISGRYSDHSMAQELFSFIPAVYIASGAFFACMNYVPGASFGGIFITEMVYLSLGLFFGWMTIAFRGWYEKREKE